METAKLFRLPEFVGRIKRAIMQGIPLGRDIGLCWMRRPEIEQCQPQILLAIAPLN